MKDFRPISICNVIYKVVSKVLANIIKFMPYIVSDIQCTFIEGRAITNNIIIANENPHFMKGKRKMNDYWTSLKLILLRLLIGLIRSTWKG